MDHQATPTESLGREPDPVLTRADAIRTGPSATPAALARGSAAEIPMSAGEPPPRSEHPGVDPDGVPLDVIGLLVFVVWLMGGAIVASLILGSWLLALVAGVVLGSLLVHIGRRAKRERVEKYRDTQDLLP